MNTLSLQVPLTKMVSPGFAVLSALRMVFPASQSTVRAADCADAVATASHAKAAKLADVNHLEHSELIVLRFTLAITQLTENQQNITATIVRDELGD
jgi:uncharacterized protein (UPF0333 family)